MTFSAGTGLGGFPGCQKRFVQGAPLPARDVIAFVVGNQIDNRTLGQGCRLVEDEPPLLDTCSESAHMATVRDSKVLGKRSRARWRWDWRIVLLSAYYTGLKSLDGGLRSTP